MWLLLESETNTEARGFAVLKLVMSLGVPEEIGRVDRRVWGLHMRDARTAHDAEWVLRKHQTLVNAALGTDKVTIRVVQEPPAFTHTQRVGGRAEA